VAVVAELSADEDPEEFAVLAVEQAWELEPDGVTGTCPGGQLVVFCAIAPKGIANAAIAATAKPNIPRDFFIFILFPYKEHKTIKYSTNAPYLACIKGL